jgi:hypothetical protein
MTRLAMLLVVVLACYPVVLIQGCSDRQETTTVTQRTDGGAVETQGTQTPADSQPSTTTTTTTQSNEPDSVLGATAHAIGTIILFPFRLIGDALGLLV